MQLAPDRFSAVHNYILEGQKQNMADIGALLNLLFSKIKFPRYDEEAPPELDQIFDEKFMIENMGISETEYEYFMDHLKEQPETLELLKTKNTFGLIELIEREKRIYRNSDD